MYDVSLDAGAVVTVGAVVDTGFLPRVASPPPPPQPDERRARARRGSAETGSEDRRSTGARLPADPGLRCRAWRAGRWSRERAALARQAPAVRARTSTPHGPADLRRARPAAHALRRAGARDLLPAAGGRGGAHDPRSLRSRARRRRRRPRRCSRSRSETMRAAGLSGNKTASIRDLAEQVLAGDVELDRVARLSDDEIVRELTLVRGIGRWTAEMFLMFQLGRLDVWPVDDLGVRKGYGILFDLPTPPTAKVLEPLGEPFRPYRSLAAWYCWRAADTQL